MRVREQWQHVLAELVEEAGLVLAGRVQDQLVEAEVDVAPDAGGDLLGVVRDDEAGRRALCVRVRQPLHLDRVLDALLLLGRERQGGPPGARLARVVGVAVVRDLDLDHVMDLAGVATRRLGALDHIGEQPVVELRVLSRSCR